MDCEMFRSINTLNPYCQLILELLHLLNTFGQKKIVPTCRVQKFEWMTVTERTPSYSTSYWFQEGETYLYPIIVFQRGRHEKGAAVLKRINERWKERKRNTRILRGWVILYNIPFFRKWNIDVWIKDPFLKSHWFLRCG